MKMEIRETDADCCVSTRPSKIDPLSVIKQDEIREWRRRYSLPDDVTIHARGPNDRASDFEVDEVPVHGDFLESEFWDRIPSLIANYSSTLKCPRFSLKYFKATNMENSNRHSVSWRIRGYRFGG